LYRGSRTAPGEGSPHTGPVWFNEKAINGVWKWTIQLDINIPAFGR